jgi:hypothetical protein
MYKSCRREVCRIVSVRNTCRSTLVRFLYTGERFLQSHLRVSKLRAASLHFRHVPEALTTCSTAAMCDRILPITSTGNSSIPSTRLPSIFHTRLFVSQFSSGFYIIQLFQEQGGVTKKEEGAEHLSSGYNALDRLPSRDNTLKLHRSFSKLGSLA